MRALALAALLVSGLGGCTLFDDHPDRSCRGPQDCFRAQGEVCNTVTKQCEVPPDAGTTLEEADDEELELPTDEVIE